MPNFEAPQPAAGQPHDPTEDYQVPETHDIVVNQAPVSKENIPVTHGTLDTAGPVSPDTRPTIAEGVALFSDWQGEPTPAPVAESDAGQHVEPQDENPEEVAEVDVRELDDSALDAMGKEEERLAAVQAESARNKLPGVGAALRQMTSGTFTDDDIWKELDAKKDEPEDEPEDESADQPESEPEA